MLLPLFSLVSYYLTILFNFRTLICFNLLTVISFHVEPIQVVGDLQLDSYSETAVGPVMLYVQRTPIAATAAAASGAQAGKYDIVAVLSKRQIL